MSIKLKTSKTAIAQAFAIYDQGMVGFIGALMPAKMTKAVTNVINGGEEERKAYKDIRKAFAVDLDKALKEYGRPMSVTSLTKAFNQWAWYTRTGDILAVNAASEALTAVGLLAPRKTDNAPKPAKQMAQWQKDMLADIRDVLKACPNQRVGKVLFDLVNAFKAEHLS